MTTAIPEKQGLFLQKETSFFQNGHRRFPKTNLESKKLSRPFLDLTFFIGQIPKNIFVKNFPFKKTKKSRSKSRKQNNT